MIHFIDTVVGRGFSNKVLEPKKCKGMLFNQLYINKMEHFSFKQWVCYVGIVEFIKEDWLICVAI